jgi:hypothetical protein
MHANGFDVGIVHDLSSFWPISIPYRRKSPSLPDATIAHSGKDSHLLTQQSVPTTRPAPIITCLIAVSFRINRTDRGLTRNRELPATNFLSGAAEYH